MNTLIVALALAAMTGLVLLMSKQRMKLADVADEEFLRLYRQRFDTPEKAVFAERRYLAETLGVPYRKLAPNQTWEQLEKHAPLIGFKVGETDVGSDMDSLFKRAGLKMPDPFPRTIGETIYELSRARSRLGRAS